MFNSSYWYPLASLIAACLVSSATAKISCYNNDGQPVDWFIIYKLPKHVSGSGYTYMYMDPSTNGWEAGNHSINDPNAAVGKTLEKLYNETERQTGEIAYVLYNDQSSVNFHSYGGHTKGVVLLDQKQGFWLVHSTPHFPFNISHHYEWPRSGLKNGQSLLCVTYLYSQFQDIGTQLLYNDPHVYYHSVPPPFDTDLVNLTKAATGEKVELPNRKRAVTLSSAAGKRFISFAKCRKFGDDLYSGWVADFFRSDLLAQTWPNSAHSLPSNCSTDYAVYNVKTITFNASTSFKDSEDHSKWCVTMPEKGVKWTCIGDINRDKAQEHRGGGTICTDDPVIWDSFSSLVTSVQFCACSCTEKEKLKP